MQILEKITICVIIIEEFLAKKVILGIGRIF